MVIYCIHPSGGRSSKLSDPNGPGPLKLCSDNLHHHGLRDDEAHSALTLAQKARGLVTEAASGRWCLKATKQEIRDKISEQKNRMMSQGEREVHNTYKLAELTQNLQVIHSEIVSHQLIYSYVQIYLDSDTTTVTVDSKETQDVIEVVIFFL